MKKNFYAVERFMTPKDIEIGQDQIKEVASNAAMGQQETAEWLERHRALENSWLFYGGFPSKRDAEKEKEALVKQIGGDVRIKKARITDRSKPINEAYEHIEE